MYHLYKTHVFTEKFEYPSSLISFEDQIEALRLGWRPPHIHALLRPKELAIVNPIRKKYEIFILNETTKMYDEVRKAYYPEPEGLEHYLEWKKNNAFILESL